MGPCSITIAIAGAFKNNTHHTGRDSIVGARWEGMKRLHNLCPSCISALEKLGSEDAAGDSPEQTWNRLLRRITIASAA